MNLSEYFNFANGKTTYGLTTELIAFFVSELYNQKKENIILVASNLYESNKLYNAIKLHQSNCELFPRLSLCHPNLK